MTSTSTSHQKYAELINLRNAAGQNIYQRLTLADAILSDRDWVTAPDGGGGDESRAIDRLEEHCFADVCGALSLPEMLEILHHVPDVRTWEKNRYNLRKMHAEYKERTRPRKTPAPEAAPSTRPAPEEQVKALRKENADLKHENAELRREVRKLRRLLKRFLDEARTVNTADVA